MRQEAAAEKGVVVELDGAALPDALDALGAAATGAVQGQPPAAVLHPAPDGDALRGVRIRARDVGDQEPAHGQPLLDVTEVIGDRGRDLLLGQELEQLQTGVVVVVAGARAGRKSAGDEMGASRCRVRHGTSSRV